MPFTSGRSLRCVLRFFALTLLTLLLVSTEASAQFIISEFRLRGPSGVNSASDEFIEIMNNSAAPVTVASATGTGLGVAASDGVLRCTIPNGTVVPARGHYLCVNSVGYSLATYPAGSGTAATGDATYTTDIADNAGIALFNTNIVANFAIGTRLDAVGAASEANTLYKEGTGYPTLTPFSIDYSFVRDACGKKGNNAIFGPCPNGGFIVDTNNNANDFYFTDTNGTSAGAGQRLAAPGPENLSSPTFAGASIAQAPLDTCALTAAAPNTVRDFTSNPGLNSTFGTIDLRRTLTNNTGANITRLRFRIIDLTTFPAPAGVSDLRPITSTSLVVNVNRPPCASGTSNITVQGTTLEVAPAQPNGGGWNSTLSANSVATGTPLANGASIDVRFLMGIQQTGNYKLGLIVEALPGGAGSLIEFSGNTDCAFDLDATSASFTTGGGNGSVTVTETGTCTWSATSNVQWIAITGGGGLASGSRSVTYSVSATTVTAQRIGTITIDGQTFTVTQDGLIAGRGDFDGDGKTDILIRDSSTGAIGLWIMNGATIVSGALIGSPGGTYTVAGVGDFNGDGKADILLRDSLGNLGMWLMNGSTITSGSFVGSPGAYTVAAVADFNGDLKADILLRDSLGNLGIWFMNGSTITSGALVGSPGGYSVVAATDFNGDGKADILLRDSLGNLGMWIMNGSTIVSGAFVGSPGSIVVGAADYNGDGKADILLRDSLGNLGMWFMNGSAITSGALVGSPGAYAVAGVGNYDGDTHADILLRNTTTGEVGLWTMNGSAIIGGGLVGPLSASYEVR